MPHAVLVLRIRRRPHRHAVLGKHHERRLVGGLAAVLARRIAPEIELETG
jgi:hypothetical protein